MDKKIIKKNEIIRKSINLMYLKGFNGTSVKDVTDAAGIPKGSFYNYFENKEHYAIEALRFYQMEFNAQYLEILEDTTLNPLERIKRFYAKKIDSYKELNFKLGCFVGNMTQEMGDVNVIISETTNELHRRISSNILTCLLEAKEKYNFNPKIKDERLADFIVNSWQGALLRMKSSKNIEPLDVFYQVLIDVLLT